MRSITAKAKYTDEEIKKLEGYFIQDHHIDTIIDYDCDVYRLDGDKEILLLSFRGSFKITHG